MTPCPPPEPPAFIEMADDEAVVEVEVEIAEVPAETFRWYVRHRSWAMAEMACRLEVSAQLKDAEADRDIARLDSAANLDRAKRAERLASQRVSPVVAAGLTVGAFLLGTAAGVGLVVRFGPR